MNPMFYFPKPFYYMGADRPQTPVLRFFDKKARPEVQARGREGVEAVEVEHTSERTVVEATAEQEQAFACILIVIVRDISC